MALTAPAPVDYTTQQANPVNTMGSIMNMAQTAQNIKRGNLQLQGEQQANTERQAVLPVIQSLMQPDGTFDLSQAGKITAVAPQTGDAYISRLADTNSKSAIANSNILNLDKARQDYVSQALPGLKNKPAADVLGSLNDLATETPTLKPFVDQLTHQIGNAVTAAGTDQKAQQDAVGKILDFNSKRVLTLQQQNDLMTPKYANTGGVLTNISPAASGAPDLPVTLSPGERQSVTFNQAGQPMTIGKDSNGNVTGISGTPVGGKAQQPFVMPQGENDMTLKFAQGIRQDANTTAASVPQTQAFANNAINYSKGATTGVGASLINNLRGQYAGTPWTAPGVTDSNLMGHALSQMTGSLVQSSGLSTNQGQSLAANQVADGQWDKTAIQTASREIRALSSGANLFNQAVENNTAKVAQNDPSASQFVPRDVKNAWSKVADVNAFKLYDALKNKESDPEGLTNKEGTGILDKLGGPTKANPKGSVIYQQTINNIRKMQGLVNGNLQ